MPSPLYNNATLAEAEKRRRFGVTIEAPLPSVRAEQEENARVENDMRGGPFPWPPPREAEAALPQTRLGEPDDDTGGIDPLEAAKQYLAQAPDLSGVASLDDRATALSRPTRGFPRQITDALEQMATPLALGSLIPSPVQPAAVGLAAGAYGLAGLRKLLMPEADESRVGGALEAGLSALPAVGSLARGRHLKRLREAIDPEAAVVRETVNTARQYLGEGATRRQAAQRAGWPLGQSTASTAPPTVATPSPSRRALEQVTEGPEAMQALLARLNQQIIRSRPRPGTVSDVPLNPAARQLEAERQAIRGTSHGPTADYWNGRKYDRSLTGDAQTAAGRTKGRAMRAWAARRTEVKD